MYDGEDDARPAKRQKTDQETSSEHDIPPQLTLANLLLGLPSLLLHPPTHTNHERSLALSHHALKKCTAMTSLDRAVECRAATGLAELGLQIGLSSLGNESEIQKAITKGSLIAQNLPSLQSYRHRLAQLSSQLSLESGNPKAAQNTLKRTLSTFTQNDPPHVVYTLHLALISSISSQSSDETTNIMRSLGVISDLHECASERGDQAVIQLASVLRLRALMCAGLWSDVEESMDATESVLDMQETLKSHEDDKGKTQEQGLAKALPSPPSSTKSSRSTFEYALIVHTLILGIIFHTYVGDSSLANPRLKWLHELLDTHLSRFPKTGIFEIPFANSFPLYYQLTHPRVIYALGFLVSSLAKRDLIGRKPKKKVFAAEGIIAVDKEMKKELAFPPWASIADVRNTDLRLKRLRADMMCELIGASIMRSEFDEAIRTINETISYTRAQGIFSSYVARLTLHEAQLAHALNKPSRALQCYQIAAWLSRKRDHHRHSSSTYTRSSSTNNTPTKSNPKFKSTTLSDVDNAVNSNEENDTDGEEDFWLNTAARAGELWLRIGLLRQMSPKEIPEEEREKELNVLRKIAGSVTKDCRGLGGTLEAIAEVLDSCLTKEFVKAKYGLLSLPSYDVPLTPSLSVYASRTYLRRALNLSTASQDNHLRALVLSLIASHYLHTSNQHAEKMLETAESLAAGLGAQPKPSKMQAQASPAKGSSATTASSETLAVGNAHLRLWVGERFLELYNRAGNKEAAKERVVKNRNLKEAVTRVETRG
ncbi:hypothetical protein D9756_006286 [Leucocoprinus leucothites]|uniref:Uncharacterized protein n=1 Tax=Leucocoprinus leucothites TaxID=201217 RepID=A0A8H5FXT7_9AGAR|nr:hypothetical protein D9756_006286 [Leucoagaricus leucothites]